MAFKSFDEVTKQIELPIGGKIYTLPRVSAQDGLRFKLATEVRPGHELEPLPDDEFETIFLGDVKQQMLDDNVPAEAIDRALATAVANHTAGRDTAELMWETGGDPKVVAEYLRRRAPNRASRRSTRGGRAKRAPSPASSSPMTSPPTAPGQ